MMMMMMMMIFFSELITSISKYESNFALFAPVKFWGIWAKCLGQKKDPL